MIRSKTKKRLGIRAMKDVFIGLPTKEEIELYLKQKEFSLLNMQKLRCEIISTNYCVGEPDHNFFQEIFPDDKKGYLQEKTNMPIKFFYGIKDAKSDIDNNIECTNMLNVNTKAFRKLTIKNTQRNTGYKYVKLQYRSKKVFFGEFKALSNGCFSRIGRVKWSPESMLIPHNPDGTIPILKKQRSRSTKELPVKRKVKVTVETKVVIPQFEFDTNFHYKINK